MLEGGVDEGVITAPAIVKLTRSWLNVIACAALIEYAQAARLAPELQEDLGVGVVIEAGSAFSRGERAGEDLLPAATGSEEITERTPCGKALAGLPPRGGTGANARNTCATFAGGQSVGLFADVLMVAQRCSERQAETLVLSITQGDGVCEALLGLESKGLDRLTECQELLFRLSHQLDENVPVSSTASSKTTHDLFECLREVSSLALELGSPLATLRGDVVDEV